MIDQVSRTIQRGSGGHSVLRDTPEQVGSDLRILYIHQHFSTPDGAGGVRSYQFARRWVERGASVEIWCGTGFDPSICPGRTVLREGVVVRAFGVRYRNQMGFFARIGSFLSFALRTSIKALRARGFDVVIGSSTPLTVAMPALLASRFGRAPLVFEVRDVWPDAAIEAGVLRNGLLASLARSLERRTYQSASRIVALSTGMADRIARKGPWHDKIVMLPNCCDLDLFERCELLRSSKRSELGASGKCIILYAGAISLANDVEFLIQVIRRLRARNDIEFWFAGSGNRFEALRAAIAESSATNARLFGAVPKKELRWIFSAADVGIVSFIGAPLYYENSPNKFFDYIAAGLPVIFNRTTWLEPFITRYNAGLVCARHDVEETASAILRLAEDRDLRRQMGRNARSLAEAEFSRDVIARRYFDLLSGIATGNSVPAETGAS